jgi:hypothetical protein
MGFSSGIDTIAAKLNSRSQLVIDSTQQKMRLGKNEMAGTETQA